MQKKGHQIILPDFVTTEDLVGFLVENDRDYVPPISKKVDLVEYAEKLRSNAVFCVARDQQSLKMIGLIAFYCNDPQKINAYISVIGVSESARGQGLARAMFDRVLVYVQEIGFASISFQTWESNVALSFYESRGFRVYEKLPGKLTHECILRMRKDLRRVE